ncbi:hypothetical protein C1H76_0985 [Elsinoe australis]|uniref:Uncharacterized protein n=1 Tax=Elsinoe australis TaxID=40998 RepID=A0A4U7BAR3_9PEZI|nr:hypothetical protein C1H76_0985 [Elsinoe australis]
MKLQILFLNLLVVLVAASNDALPKRKAVAGCPALKPQISVVKNLITHPNQFCKYYLDVKRSRSPVSSLNARVLAKACRCILQQAGVAIPSQPAVNPPDAASTSFEALTCVTKYRKAIKAEFKQPKPFCKFFGAIPRSQSPVPGLTASQIIQGCQCFLAPGSTVTTEDTTEATTEATATSSTDSITTSSSTSITTSDTPATDAAGCEVVAPTAPITAYNTYSSATVTGTFSKAAQGTGRKFTGTATVATTSFPGSLATTAAVTSCASIVLAAQITNPQVAMDVYTDAAASTWGCAAFQDLAFNRHADYYNDNGDDYNPRCNVAVTASATASTHSSSFVISSIIATWN